MHPSWGLCWPSHSHHSQQPSSRAEAPGVHGAHHAHAPRRNSQQSRVAAAGSAQQAHASTAHTAASSWRPLRNSVLSTAFTGSILAVVGSHIIMHCACKRQPQSQFASSSQLCIHSTASHQNPHKKRHFSLFSEALSEQSYNFRECEHFSFFDGPGTWQSSTWQSSCLLSQSWQGEAYLAESKGAPKL
jgi:hypothetical protein